jgi:hypothetical protein
MATKVLIPAGQPVGLRLTRAEREFLLDALVLIDEEVEDKLRNVPPRETKVMLTLDDLDLLAGEVAAEANHTQDSQIERKLDRIYDRIRRLEEMCQEAK